MKKPTLLILAAGMASRYGSMKQIDGFGPNGETIIDYSIYDAINAGFGKISFIIREEFAENFKAIFEPKLKGKVETDYVFQTFDLKKYGIDKDIYREKPWGTGHAILESKNQINEPFCVINADDYYGFEAFEKMVQFLNNESAEDKYCMVGYKIGNTLSENGAVSRGVCQTNDSGELAAINERTKVYPENGKIYYEENDEKVELSASTPVSMNFWGFTPSVFPIAEKLFKQFVEENQDKPKAEFFIPLIADYLIKSKEASFKVIPTDEKWFGVTYKEDKPIVQESINKLVATGVYPSKLW
ncbi:nucleotidyltransferase family protein [Pedobacter puniceum]|jgi:NDP-sugar pyrophosphorylase family protein|uniref:Nucleotidyltransferase n=1 Tax=Pedobacter puniceum TaxID=2666136 RepID=A0A7K0FI29_9SPHI|nr:sugar phosphate nucleotidyltransferase [Pedobacter puniceum]MRX45639.1 nucleotidyltransferase [Pedobacter puniceum]